MYKSRLDRTDIVRQLAGQLRSHGAPSSLAQSRQTLRFAETARRSLQQDTKIAKQEIRVQISVEQRENSLLAALPDPEWQRWEPLLQPIDMPLGEVLYESGAMLTHVYFPATSIVSLLYVME